MGQVVTFEPHQETEQTLVDLANQPNLRFLKIFPRKGALTRSKVVTAFNDAFEQIGGVSRLSLWSDSHPEEFYKLFARLLPPATHPDLDGDREFRVRHILPPTALDGDPQQVTTEVIGPTQEQLVAMARALEAKGWKLEAPVDADKT